MMRYFLQGIFPLLIFLFLPAASAFDEAAPTISPTPPAHLSPLAKEIYFTLFSPTPLIVTNTNSTNPNQPLFINSSRYISSESLLLDPSNLPPRYENAIKELMQIPELEKLRKWGKEYYSHYVDKVFSEIIEKYKNKDILDLDPFAKTLESLRDLEQQRRGGSDRPLTYPEAERIALIDLSHRYPEVQSFGDLTARKLGRNYSMIMYEYKKLVSRHQNSTHPSKKTEISPEQIQQWRVRELERLRALRAKNKFHLLDTMIREFPNEFFSNNFILRRVSPTDAFTGTDSIPSDIPFTQKHWQEMEFIFRSIEDNEMTGRFSSSPSGNGMWIDHLLKDKRGNYYALFKQSSRFVYPPDITYLSHLVDGHVLYDEPQKRSSFLKIFSIDELDSKLGEFIKGLRKINQNQPLKSIIATTKKSTDATGRSGLQKPIDYFKKPYIYNKLRNNYRRPPIKTTTDHSGFLVDIKWWGWGSSNDHSFWQKRDQEVEKIFGKSVIHNPTRMFESSERDTYGNKPNLDKRILYTLHSNDPSQKIPQYLILRYPDEGESAPSMKLSSSKKIDSDYTVTTKSPRLAQDKIVPIASSEYALLTQLSVRDNDGNQLVEGKDYQIRGDPENRGYFISLTNPKIEAIDYTAQFQFGSKAPLQIPAEFRALDTIRLSSIIKELEISGLKELAKNLDARIFKAEREKKPLSIIELAEVFRENAIYSYEPEQKNIAKAWQNTPFADFSRFINPDGILCYQCDTANTLFKEFMKKYFSNHPSVQVIERRTGLVEANAISADRLHQETEFMVYNKSALIVDVTPSKIDSEKIALAAKKMAQEELSRPENKERLGQRHVSTLESSKQRTQNIVNALGVKRASLLKQIELAIPNANQLDASEPYLRIYRGAKALMEFLDGSLEFSQAKAKFVALFPRYEHSYTDDKSLLDFFHKIIPEEKARIEEIKNKLRRKELPARYHYYLSHSFDHHLQALLQEIQNIPTDTKSLTVLEKAIAEVKADDFKTRSAVLRIPASDTICPAGFRRFFRFFSRGMNPSN